MSLGRLREIGLTASKVFFSFFLQESTLKLAVRHGSFTPGYVGREQQCLGTLVAKKTSRCQELKSTDIERT